MAGYNAGTGARPAPIKPLGWIAGVTNDRQRQQGVRSSPTAVDADTQVCTCSPDTLVLSIVWLGL